MAASPMWPLLLLQVWLGLQLTGMATVIWRCVMNSRALGKTGIEVSEVGLGAWQLGEPPWNGPGEQESMRIVDEALALGCTFVDTAPAYGGGRSEALLGQALAGRRGGWLSARSSATGRIVVLTSAPTASRTCSWSIADPPCGMVPADSGRCWLGNTNGRARREPPPSQLQDVQRRDPRAR